MEGKILVLDTAAFVKNVPIWNYAEEFYTCKEVIREIRDKQAKAFYKSLPVEIKIKEPAPHSLKFINEFSKKTGDYPSLSLADSKILALTYELDIQANKGSEHLRSEPKQAAAKTVTNITTKIQTHAVPKNIPGFYYPKENRKLKTELASEFSGAPSENTFEERILEPKPELLQELNAQLCDNTYLEGVVAMDKDFEMASQLESYYNSLLSSDLGENKIDDFNLKYPYLSRWLKNIIALMEDTDELLDKNEDYCDINVISEVDEDFCDTDHNYYKKSSKEITPQIDQPSDESPDDEGWQTVSRKTRNYTPSEYAPSVLEEEGDSDISSDDEGWINSENIDLLKNLTLNDLEENDNALTACITCDFAVQNVLKHIGLQVIGVDGKVIKRVKSYLLRCYACFKLTSNMERLFCYHCGHKTLKRVAVHVNEDGSQEIWINATRPINTKGINKPIPRPRGGKYSNNPILVADQRFPQQRLSKASRKKADPLDEDYKAGTYFGTRDIYSRAAVLGRIEGNNPNRMSHKKSKRKKTKY